MSERGKQRRAAQSARSVSEVRFGTTFWDGVESEVEALDFADFALFLRADQLAIEPRPAFARALSGHLASVFRARWSN
jgi:hypothetical protein